MRPLFDYDGTIFTPFEMGSEGTEIGRLLVCILFLLFLFLSTHHLM